MDRRGVAIIIAGFSTFFAAFSIRYGYGLILPEMLPSLSISKTEAGVILIGFSYLLISFSILIPFLFLTTYAIQELKITYSSGAYFLAVAGVAGAIAKLILGPISDFAGRVKVMMLCGVLVAVGGLGFAYARGFAVLILFTAVFGAGYGTIWPVFAASARDFFPKEYAGSIVGLWTVFHGLGSVIAPVFAGWTIDATGTYFWVFLLTVASAILSSLLLLPLSRIEK